MILAFYLKSILSWELIHETREKINEDLDTSKEVKEMLKELEFISSGIIFKARSVCLVKSVFDVHMDNK